MIGASQSLLLVLVTYTLTEVKKIMATLQEIKTTEQEQNERLNVISTDVADLTRKVNVLIAQGSAGGGLNQAALDVIAGLQEQVNAQIGSVSSDLQALEDTVDANLGPHPEPVR